MIRVVPLDGTTWNALEALFREGGDPRWCWCQYWRLRSRDFAALKVPELRARLQSLADGPRPPGLVALDGDDPPARAVGWVGLGPRAEFERIVRSRVIPTIDDRQVWSITCFAVSSGARGRGVARLLLDGALEFARTNGVRTVEAYPVLENPAGGVTPEAAFTGTWRMFERAGFVIVAARASDPSASHPRVVARLQL